MFIRNQTKQSERQALALTTRLTVTKLIGLRRTPLVYTCAFTAAIPLDIAVIPVRDNSLNP